MKLTPFILENLYLCMASCHPMRKWDLPAPELNLGNLENNLELVKTIGSEDSEIFNLQFSKEPGMADKRKEWLNIEG